MRHLTSLSAIALLTALPARGAETALDNAYVHVTRDGAPCAAAATAGLRRPRHCRDGRYRVARRRQTRL